MRAVLVPNHPFHYFGFSVVIDFDFKSVVDGRAIVNTNFEVFCQVFNCPNKSVCLAEIFFGKKDKC